MVVDFGWATIVVVGTGAAVVLVSDVGRGVEVGVWTSVVLVVDEDDVVVEELLTRVVVVGTVEVGTGTNVVVVLGGLDVGVLVGVVVAVGLLEGLADAGPGVPSATSPAPDCPSCTTRILPVGAPSAPNMRTSVPLAARCGQGSISGTTSGRKPS